MSSHIVEPKSDVEGHINNIKKILEIKDHKKKHFSCYYRDDEESIEVTLANLDMTYSDFKKTIYNLEINDYLYSVKDKINTYGLLPVFLVKIKEIVIYIKTWN